MLLLLLGCATWFDKGTACEYKEVYVWSDDLLAHILTNDEGDGSFDYDPDDDPRERIEGSYDFGSGEFDWKVSYDNDYFLTETEVEGEGTAFHDGNLDLLYTETTVDVLEVESVYDYRVLRDGCDVTIASWDAEDGDLASAFVQQGEYTDADKLEWEAEDDAYTYQGTLRDNLSRSLSIVAKDESYEEYREEKPDGTSEGWWTGACGTGIECEVDRETAFDGSREERWTILQDGDELGSGSGEFDYDGSGTLEIDYDGNVCTYTYTSSGKCTYDCDDGTSGRC